MSRLTRYSAALFLSIALGIPAPVPADETPPAAGPVVLVPSYVRRGDEVEVRYKAYRERLAHFHAALGEALEREAPDLYAQVNAAPPGSAPDGYQILPRIVPGPPPGASRPKVASNSFSWPRTEQSIAADLARLERVEAAVGRAVGLPPDERRRAWEQTAREYLRLAASQKVIDSNVKYNRLWQDEIHRRPAVYDRFTALHDAVVERQAILDAIHRGDASLPPGAREREQGLARQIGESTGEFGRPEFIRLERPAPHVWVVRVPFSTDIADRSYVSMLRSAVESIWRVQDGADEFQVRLDVQHIAPDELYRGESPPSPGARLDLGKHLAHFPPGRAILTTGATLTHVNVGWSINLGPLDVSDRVLSHELGHILGFPDGYFRGYRDRGAEGYEVLEVITGPDDIMSAPGFGRAQLHHFVALLASFGVDTEGRPQETADALMKSGLDALYTKGDPATAVTAFGKVLAKHPNHYGANSQLARALDRAGKPDEARPVWEKVLKMAEGYNDVTTMAAARERLARRP